MGKEKEMKKTILLTGLALVISISSTGAYAAPGVVTKAVRERTSNIDETTRKRKEEQEARLKSNKEYRARVIESFETMAGMKGTKDVLENVLQMNAVQSDGSPIAVSKVVTEIVMTKKTLAEIEKTEKNLTAEDKAEIAALTADISTLVKSLLLLSGTTPGSDGAKAVAKQIGLIPEILKMEAAERNSHIAIIKSAVEIMTKKDGFPRNIQGDVALRQAIADYYKKDVNDAFVSKKIEELINCSKG